jgi:hypothetical protein
MALQFGGSYEDLKKCVALTNFSGWWRNLENHQKQYRTDDGAILNWWETTGTIMFQGRDRDKEFKKAFIASARRLLEVKAKRHAQLQEEQARLQKLVKDSQADIARLKWQELRKVSPTMQQMIAAGLADISKLIRRL